MRVSSVISIFSGTITLSRDDDEAEYIWERKESVNVCAIVRMERSKKKTYTLKSNNDSEEDEKLGEVLELY